MTVIVDEEQLISAAEAGNPNPKSLPHSFQQGSGSTVDMTWLIKQENFIWREQTGWPEENVSDLCLCITSRKFKTFGQETFQGSTRKSTASSSLLLLVLASPFLV